MPGGGSLHSIFSERKASVEREESVWPLEVEGSFGSVGLFVSMPKAMLSRKLDSVVQAAELVGGRVAR